MKPKILFLNPPGRHLYIRDYFCSKISKADYINAPIDLVMLSGIFNTGEFKIGLIDAIVEKLSPQECMEKIGSFEPNTIIALTGSVSLDEDIIFFKRLSEGFKGDIFIIGDFLLTEHKKFLEENSYLKGVILNFISPGVFYYIKGEKEKVCDLVCREDEKIVIYPKNNIQEFRVNIPKHEEFIKRKYRLPFTKKTPFVTTLTSYGCPFQCTFCVMNTFRHVERNYEDLFIELDYIEKLGVKEVCFLDQTIGVNRERFLNILNGMIERNYSFGWFGFTRVDIIDEGLLCLMKKAGCHTIWFGVESASDEILKRYRKGYDKNQIIRAFEAAKKVGIKTLATFLLGLPEENKEMIEDTIKFSKDLDPDYASFNFAVPRFGTELRRVAIQEGLVDRQEKIMNQSGQEIAMGTKNLSRQEIQKLRRKAIFSFYFRPKYLIKRLLSLRSFAEFKTQAKNVYLLIRNEM